MRTVWAYLFYDSTDVHLRGNITLKLNAKYLFANGIPAYLDLFRFPHPTLINQHHSTTQAASTGWIHMLHPYGCNIF